MAQHFDKFVGAAGGVARLRELILAQAVRGKLVPQNPDDEPASLLLRRIQATRADASRPKQRAEATHGLEPLCVPLGWVCTALADIGLINPRNDASDGVMASFVQMSSIPTALLNPHLTEPRRWADIKSGFTHFADGDVGVAKITPCFENGKSAVFQGLDNGIGAGTTELLVVRPLCGIDPRYVLIFLKSPGFLDGGEAVMTGTAGQKRLPRSYFERCPFPLPPLAEQARIVARVDELMRLCDDLEAKGRLEAEQHARLLDTLLGTLTASTTPDELAANWRRVAEHFDLLLDRPEAVDALEQTVLQLAVRGLLEPQDTNDEPASASIERVNATDSRPRTKRSAELQPIESEDAPFVPPSGWMWTRFGTVAVVSGGVTLGRKGAIARPLTLPYLRVANVQRWKLDLHAMKTVTIDASEHERFRLALGDLLVTEGGDWDKVGRTAIWRSELATCLHQNHVFKARGRSPEWNAEWAELYLNSDLARAYFAASAKQTTNLASINMTELKSCLFPMPPVAEQSRIVARVTELRRLCADLRQRLAAQQAVQSHLADALIDQALT